MEGENSMHDKSGTGGDTLDSINPDDYDQQASTNFSGQIMNLSQMIE